MKTELQRYKEALEVAKAAMKECAEILFIEGAHEFRQRTLVEINAILNPPPETVDIPIERWAVVAPSGYIEQTFSSEACANDAVALPKYGQGYEVAKLTGTIKRPKPQMVERSVTVDVCWAELDTNVYPVTVGAPFDWKALIGKKNSLTIAWLEYPKEEK